MEPKERIFSSAEVASSHIKIDGILRIISIISAFIFWYLIAITLLLLLVSGALPYSSFLSFAQACIAIGLLPIPAVVVTRKFFE